MLKQRKMIVMGRQCVGKSSLVGRMIKRDFTEHYYPTFESTYHTTVTVRGATYDVEIVDTSGQDEYSNVVPLQHSMNVDGYCLVYSVTSYDSFLAVQAIHRRLVSATGRSSIPVVLVANKMDLTGEAVVDADTGRQLAAKWGTTLVETSAKEDRNVAFVLDILLRDIQLAEGDLLPRKSWWKKRRTSLWSCVGR